MSHALLFPGQGAQAVGMGKDLAEKSPAARRVFADADSVLGFALSKVCFEGPQEELNRTDVSQPAIVAHSWAVVEAIREADKGELLDSATWCAGLSLGEYSALAAAGAMSWQDALKLVRKRGQFMQDACDAVPSTMASILGLDEAPLGEACAEATALGLGPCVMANFNAPGQIVIAGTKESVAKACELAKAKGAKRAIELSVAGAFHSPLMEPARERLAAEIDQVTIADPRIPVIANVSGQPVTMGADAKRRLLEQLTAPVRWADSMQYLVDIGCDSFYELGPGEVLAGLLKRVAKEQPKLSIGTAEQVAQLSAQ